MRESPSGWAVAVDLRCLQDENYAERGVGRHACALLRAAPPGVRLVGIIDPALPPPIAAAAATLHATVPNAYAAQARGEGALAGFVSLSPVTHDPLFTARLAADPALLRAAVVYDFIPRREPERYLPNPAARVAYATALSWLRRFDLFLPISQATADEIGPVLGAPDAAIALTGAALDERFEQIAPARAGRTPRHLLVVGGGDPRKNPEVVIRAHARSRTLQRMGVELVVAGSYGRPDAAAFQALAGACGGDPALVRVPGHVSDEQLFRGFADAYAVVCPSRDEGFSLPVVEGMAAGLPSLASDIPAHRELVTDPALRFAPEDDAALLPLLERAVTDPAWRAGVVASQAAVWPRFRADAVGARFWQPILQRLEAGLRRPAVNRGRRPRVAVLSPMPPERSGVSDYTAATCIEFGKLVELDVFSGAGHSVSPPGVDRMLPLNALPHLRPRYDRVVSVVGNSHFHLKLFDYMRRYGSACIAHDARMIGFYRYLLGIEHSLAVAAREVGRPVSEAELESWIADEASLKALFLGEIAATASPSIVHSPVTATLFEERYGVRPAYLPFSIYRPWTADQLSAPARAAARERLGVGPGQIVIATFGYVQETKAPEDCVWALETLRHWGFDARLDFVGSTDYQSDKGVRLRALIARLGLGHKVRFAPSYVPEQTYGDYLVGADLAIQLRTYGFGALSGGLLDCAAAGLPTVTNHSLGEAVGTPTSYVSRIPDAISPPLLAEALANLLEDGPSPSRREAERAEFSDQRSFRRYAASLCEVLGL